MAIAGVVFSSLTVFSCDFLESSQGAVLESVGVTNSSVTYLGLVYFEDPTMGDKCTLYPDEVASQFSAMAQCARISGMIAPACALIALILYLVEFFFRRFFCARCIQATFLFAAFITQALTFLAYGTDEFW